MIVSNIMDTAKQNREYFYEGHTELSIKSIGDATSSAKMKSELCDVAFDDEGTSVWFWKANKGEESGMFLIRLYLNNTKSVLV